MGIRRVPKQITNTEEIKSVISSLKDGVSTDGDTLAKLRNLIGGIQTLLNSDDVNLDSLQEIVNYIKNNQTILEGVTINKVSVSDIINDLLHTDVNKPLSAKQGKVLKDFIDVLQNKVNIIVNTGQGTKFLADDGSYKAIDNTSSTGHIIRSEAIEYPKRSTLEFRGVAIIDNEAQNKTIVTVESLSDTNVKITDGNNHFTATTLNGVLDELFISASNGKNAVVNAIGDSSLITQTLLGISDGLVNKKLDIVNALNTKGIVASVNDDLGSYANKINSIVQNSQIKNTKLNKTSGSTYNVVLTNPTTIQNVCTSVLELHAGETGMVQYDCGFNNSDSTNFINVSNISFNGTMSQNNQIIESLMDITSQSSTFINGTEYTANVDTTQFHTFDMIEGYDSGGIQKLRLSGTYFPVLVQANSDINLNNVKSISGLTWIANCQNSSKLLMLFSTDGGVTWSSYDRLTQTVLNVDISNNLDIENKGMSITDVNNLSQLDRDAIRNGSLKLRFAYYFNKNSMSDLVFNDEIILKVDMNGVDTFSTNYTVSYNELSHTITYRFTKDGTYTIIYTDNN